MEKTENNAQTIDLQQIVESRAGKGRIPRFAIRWMEKFLHVDLINEYLSQGYEGVDFCEKCLEFLDVDVKVEGLERLDAFPEGAKFTFASNHPLGGIDGITLGKVFGRRFDGRIRYLVNDFLMNIKGLAPMCVPINIIGSQSRDLPRLIDEAFASDDNIIIFPAGLCSRKIDGRIQDREWGKAFVSKSVRNGRYIVPVHFIGENSKRFYRIATLCKRLKLKFNFAMLCLPDEMYRGMHGSYTVKIGDPVPAEKFDKSKTPYEWAQWVREEVYKL